MRLARPAEGTEVADRAVQVPDPFATVAKCLGQDAGKKYETSIDRPIMSVDGGKPVAELLA